MIPILATYDYHIHTNFSHDADDAMEHMIISAKNLGLKEIVFTDHYDYVYPDLPYPCQINYRLYYNELVRLKEKYSDDLNIMFGVEVALGPELADNIAGFVNAYDFDFVIGSVHDMYGKDFYFDNFFEGKTKTEAYNSYLDYLLESIKKTTEICVVGHLDYVSRYSGYADPFISYDEFKEPLDKILIELISTGRGIEVNTSGYRYGIENVYPNIDILKRYKQLGGEIITAGSDAHKAKDVGRDLDKAYGFLKQAGFEYVTIFRKRKPEFIKI